MTPVKWKALTYQHFCLISKYGNGQATVISVQVAVEIRKPFTGPSVEETKP